jgi:uncharacterized protein YhaN
MCQSIKLNHIWLACCACPQRHNIADLKEQVQTSQYAACRDAAQQSKKLEQLEQMLQDMAKQQQQQQQEKNVLQAQNWQQLQQQQAFMRQVHWLKLLSWSRLTPCHKVVFVSCSSRLID